MVKTIGEQLDENLDILDDWTKTGDMRWSKENMTLTVGRRTGGFGISIHVGKEVKEEPDYYLGIVSKEELEESIVSLINDVE
jgi:hypothetical protein